MGHSGALGLGRWAGGRSLAAEQTLSIAVGLTIFFRQGIGGELGTLPLARVRQWQSAPKKLAIHLTNLARFC